MIGQLYKAFTEKDMSLLEINPLVVTNDGKLICLDAKINFDSNALDRHPEIKELRDLTEEDPKEIEASKYDLSYVALDGSIGCMVNGAGLAMATMDIIKLYGAEPANFLDVGGGASKEKVAAAFKIITADPRVKGILVNIFGGIMKCDVIAEGVIAAVKEVGLQVPLVVRLEGTNVDLGKKIISESGLNVIPADDLDDAASKIVKADVHSRRQEHQGHLPGLHRQERHLPFRAGDCLRHPDGRRHHAGQGRHHASQSAGLRHRAEAREKTGADASVIYVPPPVRRMRSARRSTRRSADRLHHRRHSGDGHGQGEARAVRIEVAPDRAELPGRDDRGRMQDRHHAGQHLQEGQGRHRVALRHADLRGGSRRPMQASASRPASASAAIRSRAPTSSKCWSCSSPTTRRNRSS
jgi:hypothetical protein